MRTLRSPSQPISTSSIAFYIADGIGTAPMAPVGVIDHAGDMVGNHESVESDLFKGPDNLGDVRIAFPDPALRKVLDVTLDIAQVDVENSPLTTEVPSSVLR